MEVTSKPVDDVAAAKEDDDVMPPGFRFHPTDEELVGFYLRRKVEKKPITMEIIKQVDIYKYDPWDLPKMSNVGDKEWYFFCIRERKYRNSMRPNRVTSSGFWKATGIDKPIFSPLKSPDNQVCIGLKKSLVYYRGSAGKGTKTEWMMHEFRLPFNTNNSQSHDHHPYIPQDAEVWTLCRIFKRIPSFRKYSPTTITSNNNVRNPNNSNIILPSKPNTNIQCLPYSTFIHLETNPKPSEQLNPNSTLLHASSFGSYSLYPLSLCNDVNGGGRGGRDDIVTTNGSWDELDSIVQFAFDHSFQLYEYI